MPGVGSALFDSFGSPTINSSDQTLFIGSLKLGGGVTIGNSLGLWQYNGTSGTLLARTGVGNVPDIGGANFQTFDQYTQNNAGQVAINGSIDVADNRGIWRYTGGVGELLGRKGVGGVPEVAGANFEDFDHLLINDAGQVLVQAELEVGAGGVSASDNRGLWFLDGSGSLLLRTGSGGVPEVAGTNFFDFSNFSFNDSGQLAVAATLEIGVGGVDATNDSGLWLVDPNGTSLLVAREGDSLAGRTIASVDFVANSAGNEETNRVVSTIMANCSFRLLLPTATVEYFSTVPPTPPSTPTSTSTARSTQQTTSFGKPVLVPQVELRKCKATPMVTRTSMDSIF